MEYIYLFFIALLFSILAYFFMYRNQELYQTSSIPWKFLIPGIMIFSILLIAIIPIMSPPCPKGICEEKKAQCEKCPKCK